MMILESATVSEPETAVTLPDRDAVGAAVAAYRMAVDGVPPDLEFVIPSGDDFEVEAAEVETLLAAAKQRAEGGRLRRVLIPPLWEPKRPLAVRRGTVRAVLRLLGEQNDDPCEQEDLAGALQRHLAADTFGEALSCLEREPRLRTVPALIGALRASDACGFASQFRSFRSTYIGLGLVAAWIWTTPLMLRSLALFGLFQITITLLVLVGLWIRSKRHRKPCESLLQMLEQVEITDPKIRQYALGPVQTLADPFSAQPRAIREHAKRLARRQWKKAGEYLPISASEPTPSAEALPIPATEADAGGTT
jgi:hypothetical protein